MRSVRTSFAGIAAALALRLCANFRQGRKDGRVCAQSGQTAAVLDRLAITLFWGCKGVLVVIEVPIQQQATELREVEVDLRDLAPTISQVISTSTSP